MELNLAYEQDFTKKGKLSKFGGSDFGLKGGIRDAKTIQIDKLRSELQKYNISEARRNDLLEQMYKIRSIEYMNTKYLAVVLDILENIPGIYYREEDELLDILGYVFKEDKEFLQGYLDRIVDVSKENDPKYIKLVKSILLSYIYKIWTNRYKNFEV